MIEVRGIYYWSDWSTEELVKIDETKIWGFELHYRGDNSWHVVVKVKDKQKCRKSKLHPEGFYYPDYEVYSGVLLNELIKFLRNPDVKILRIVNYHSSDDFLVRLKELLNYVTLFVLAKDGETT